MAKFPKNHLFFFIYVHLNLENCQNMLFFAPYL
jgi:hypothetical protein